MGSPVAVLAERSGNSDVVANPDGTFTETFHTQPIRVRRGADWSPVDTTVVRRPDGTVGPRATSIPTNFSAGGDQPIVQLGEPGHRVSYGWSKPLPRPELAGSTAMYREVMPGVDLRLTAKPQGFAKVFIVKDRTAAARLATLRLGIATEGITMRADGQGTFGAYDGKGQLAFAIGAPLMWDSAGKRAVGKFRLESRSVTILPDQKLLTDPAAKFPLFIDPDTVGPLMGWAQVYSGKPEMEWWGGDGDGFAKVGQCWDKRGECFGIGIARSYFKFDVRGLLGGRQKIRSASFNAFLAHTPECVNKPVRAWGTAPVFPTTNWANKPANGAYLGENWSTGCPGVWLGWEAAGAVTDGIQSYGGYATIVLAASDEYDQVAWKKFTPMPTLSVTYNTTPDVPTSLTVENKPCGVAPNEAYVNPALSGKPEDGARGPRMWATVTDPNQGLVYAKFEWRDRARTTILGSKQTAALQSGSRFSVDVPAANAADGSKLSFHAIGWDGLDYSPAYSGYCDVTIDRTAPQYPPVVSSPTYTECGDDPVCVPSGAVGFTGGFSFAPGGDTDVAGYRYSLNGDFEDRYVAVGANGVAQALVTPPDRGPQRLTVKAVDRAGNVSPTQYDYDFFVGRGSAPQSYWRLNGEGTDAAVIDDASSRRDGVRPTGLASAWKGGRHGDALWLNGSTTASVATTVSSAVTTAKSFSVSAWVKLEQAGTTYRTAVSQDGAQISGFFLQYNPTSKKWNFMMPATSAGTSQRHIAESAGPVVPKRWTHLVGIFDDATKQVKLYVDGVAGTTASHPNPWAATGMTQLGRGQGLGADNWLGSLDEVQVYNRVITPIDIDELAGMPSTEELFWPFDETEGSTADDASGNYRLGEVGSTAVRTPGTVGAGAIRLDGAGAVVSSTTLPVIRTDSAFTVTARVKLDAIDGTTRTVLSQDGQQSSGFRLGYDGAQRRWFFSLSQADTATDNPVIVRDDSAPDLEWTHLSGVYDQAAGEIRLYVDGRQVGGYVAAQAKWNATGGFQVGRSRQAGQPATPFVGEIDDVHVWTGVRTGGQVADDMIKPVTTRKTAYSGQLSRFVNTNGFKMVTNGPVPPGSHFDGSLGVPASAGTPNTRTIYLCRNGATDYFLDPTCGIHTKLNSVGQFFYPSPPVGLETVLVYRCYVPGVEHFASTDPNCEGATTEFPLGYTLAYTSLVRHVGASYPSDHISSTTRLPADQRPEHQLGYLAMEQLAGTTAWMQCRDGQDTFSSTDAGCEGKTVIGQAGYVWTDPPASGGQQIFRCRASWGDLFDSRDPGCEGQTVDRPLGYVATEL